MNKLLGLLAAMQMAILFAVDYNEKKIEGILPEAATQGSDTFLVAQTADFFSSTGTSLTMVNGWKSSTVPNQCSVNLVYSDSGRPIEDTSGIIFDLHAPARRFVITDCRKLPIRVFQPYISG